MSIWVEYWIDPSKPNGSHAQMNTQKVFIEPEPESISRRFFDSQDIAQKFAKILKESRHLVRVKTDRSS